MNKPTLKAKDFWVNSPTISNAIAACKEECFYRSPSRSNYIYGSEAKELITVMPSPFDFEQTIPVRTGVGLILKIEVRGNAIFWSITSKKLGTPRSLR